MILALLELARLDRPSKSRAESCEFFLLPPLAGGILDRKDGFPEDSPKPALKTVFSSLATVGALIVGLPLLHGQTVTRTNPVGYVAFACPGNSDTIVSVPFHAAPRWRGTLSDAPSDLGGGRFRLAFSGAPTFSANELVTLPHYVYTPDSVGAPGRIFFVAANGSSTADVTASAAEIAGLANGDAIRIIPAWTLNSLFPPSSQTVFHPSSGNLVSDRQSELLFFDDITPGQDLAPRRRFFVTSSSWREAGTYASAGNVVIMPGQAFAVRHPAGSGASTFIPFQEVFGGTVTRPLRTQVGGAQDTMVAPPRPVASKLSELAMSGTSFVSSASTAPGDRKDQLLVFDNSAVATNKSPSAIYFLTPGGWVRDTVGFPASDNVTIEPSAGVLIRKAATASTGVNWVNLPSYDVTAP
jgi:uncharacterized protein (TIGR02597 family)